MNKYGQSSLRCQTVQQSGGLPDAFTGFIHEQESASSEVEGELYTLCIRLWSSQGRS